tara:strand:- start:505 stop:741 length:237 start_codon:yes stop_codon:yes gene_type:complete
MTDVVNQIDGQVQVIFERGVGAETYRDALWMSQEQYDLTSAEALEAMKDERYTNWLAIIHAAPTESIESATDTSTPQE